MSKTDLSTDLRGMLGKSAGSFDIEGRSDLDRLLNTAALALSRDKPQNLSDSLSLVAGQSDYDAPALIIKAVYSDWGKTALKERMPWEKGFPKTFPTLNTIKTATGKKIRLTPAPTAAQVVDFGSDYAYYYTASYKIGSKAIDTTVDESDRDLLLLRAVIAAMQDLAASHASVPVSLGKGVVSMAKTGTPAVLAASLLAQYEAML